MGRATHTARRHREMTRKRTPPTLPNSRAFSSAGRALPLQGRGRGFETLNAHCRNPLCSKGFRRSSGELDDLWTTFGPRLVRA
jgi:hypothetical protein